jgi:hypothetical protein
MTTDDRSRVRAAWNPVTSIDRTERLLLVIFASVLVALWLPRVLIGCSLTVAEERYWYLGDDAMISMRYAHNLADGIGLVWNPGERVEGYTNFLWTMYMAFIHVLPISLSKTSLAVLLTNIALAVATIPLIIKMVQILGGDTLSSAAALAGFALNQHIVHWMTSGNETTLFTFFLLLAMYRVIQDSQLGQPRLSSYLFIAVLPLIRADAIVLSVLLYAVSLRLNDNRKLAVTYSAISLLLPISHEIFRIYYYGDILPNTAYLKVMEWDGRVSAGWEYVLDFWDQYNVLIMLTIAGSILSRQSKRGVLLGALFLHAIYVAYVGGDAFYGFRFFIPVLPLLMALAFAGVHDLTSQQSLRLAISVLCVSTFPLIVPDYDDNIYPRNFERRDGNVEIGLILKHNTPVGSKVADSYAGSVFYFSERYGVDLLGKSDRYIARLPAVPYSQKPGHNKFDVDYSLGVLKPDYVVAKIGMHVTETKMRRRAKGNFPISGQLYFNSLFREHCLPNAVITETWRTIFACDWSSESD